MQKLIGASFILILLAALQTNAFASTLNCKFTGDAKIDGVQSIKVEDEYLIINEETEIPLDKSIVRCGHFGRQTRLDGSALGYQVILKSCSSEASLEGHVIDSVKVKSAEVVCHRD